ncbi:MAG: 5-demethoxyubiquinol-8 5-hydroxylase UbiM [Burkholderiales bacterium]|jgi:ubiquinone biosynthesis UbiH/UbiF/VisC/COQ6 family hydroxylase|nr:5-demethoxyubiquinol-8 5-hydroxylase UbiM [Burkholderiales bacterium]
MTSNPGADLAQDSLPPAAADVLVIGAGPAGLALACALADQGLQVTVLEQQEEAAIAAPRPDGRDIAMTHRALGIMESLGLWQRLPVAEVAPLRAADVHDGHTPRQLHFDAGKAGKEALGYLVPNHWLRQVAYDGTKARPGVTLRCGVQVLDVQAEPDAAQVSLRANGAAPGTPAEQLSAPLLVCADSRFSTTRRRLGIGASSRDFGRTVIVARLSHELEHNGTAHECFRAGNTLAILPMNGRQVSAVVTLRSSEAPEWMALTPEAFATRVEAQFDRRLGAMVMTGERHAYPLVAVYAHRFAQHRVALIGDAAVGMHPVTAHGYNFGLYGVEVLSRQLGEARRHGRDIGAMDTLAAYDSEHRRVTLPIYLGTNAVVTLFTDDRSVARMARQAVIAVADHLPPLKSAITHQLTGQRPNLLPTLPNLPELGSGLGKLRELLPDGLKERLPADLPRPPARSRLPSLPPLPKLRDLF